MASQVVRVSLETLPQDSSLVKLKVKVTQSSTNIMASGPITSWQIDGETMETVTRLYFLGLQNHCRWWLQPWNEKTLAPWKKSYGKPIQCIKGPYGQSYGFSSSHGWMWDLDHKESWAPKNWCFWTMVLEKTLAK